MHPKAAQNIEKLDAYHAMLSKAEELFKYAKSILNVIDSGNICYLKYNDWFTESEIDQVAYHVNVSICLNKPSLTLEIKYFNHFISSISFEMSLETAKALAETLKDNVNSLIMNEVVYFEGVNISNDTFKLGFQLKREE